MRTKPEIEQAHLHRVLYRWARRATIGAVILGPWLFGGAPRWAALALCLITSVGAGCWLLSLVLRRQPDVRGAGPGLLLLLLLAFGALQTCPLPAPVVATLNPFAARTVADSWQRLQELNVRELLPDLALPATMPATLSIAATQTCEGLCLLASYVAVVLVLANAIRRWRHVERIARMLVGSACILAVLSLIHKFTGSRKIFWVHIPRYGGSIFGPFTNRNHFAAHMNMAFGIGLGLFFTGWREGGLHRLRGWRRKMQWLSHKRASGLILLGFALMLIGGAACMTLSRGGVASLAAGLAAVALLRSTRRRRRRRRNSALTAAAWLIVAAVIWLGWEPLIARFGTIVAYAADPFRHARVTAAGDTLGIFGACPLVGCGFGAFQHIFPYFQSPPVQFGHWLHCHNDWVQALAEGGLLGCILLFAAILATVAVARSHLPSARTHAKLFADGLVMGLVAIALHSFSDYSLHKPANALLLCALCGMLLAVCHMREESAAAPPAGGMPRQLAWLRRQSTARLLAPWVRVGALLVLLALVPLTRSLYRRLTGQLAFARFLYLERLARRSSHPTDVRNAVTRASREADLFLSRCPADAVALRDIAATCFRWGRDQRIDGPTRAQLAHRAIRAAAVSVGATPTNYLAWLWLGRAYTLLGFWDEADLCLQRARALAAPGLPVRLFLTPAGARDSARPSPQAGTVESRSTSSTPMPAARHFASRCRSAKRAAATRTAGAHATVRAREAENAESAQAPAKAARPPQTRG